MSSTTPEKSPEFDHLRVIAQLFAPDDLSALPEPTGPAVLLPPPELTPISPTSSVTDIDKVQLPYSPSEREFIQRIQGHP